MRTKGLPVELERRRHLAVQRYAEGHTMEEIADFLGVAVRSVRRWVAAFRDHGDEGLARRAGAGRRPKLTEEQTHTVLAWLQDSPTKHGFRNELWTAQRVGECIRQQWGISFNRRYLSAWLRDRAITPQLPQRVPRERDPQRIAHWRACQWPRIQKKRVAGRPTWS